MRNTALLGLIVATVLGAGCAKQSPGAASLFQQSADVGAVKLRGTSGFDATSGVYTLTGSGANVWGREDAFHYTWTRTSGDLSLEAVVEFEGEGGNAHRKAGWMIRAGEEADDPYADAAVHGDGLISFQFRRVKGGETEEIRAASKGRTKTILQRTGKVVGLLVEQDGETESVGSVILDLPDNVSVGLFVCSHEAERSETARISEVALNRQVSQPDQERVTESSLEVIDLESGKRTLVRRELAHFEAPNWSRDGSYLLYNQKGRLLRFTPGGQPEMLDTDWADRCNNDHGFSPDGKWLAISHSPEDHSLIYVVSADGGEPRQVTELGPSYWHGWSPDGKTLAYCAERGGEYDIYTIPVAGGKETRLTNAPGLDDGPDYSPDGRFIYINSERTGLMKIWRITPDGKTQEQVTRDDQWADWFPHPSPDGKWIAFLSYLPDVKGHPANQEVVLRVMPVEGGEPKIVARLFGGQGTMNVPSWSPDSRKFAFVSYRLVLSPPAQQ